MSLKDVIIVKKEHIDLGIQKYGGVLDTELMQLFDLSGLSVKPYLFNDGRILLLYTGQEHGILYASKEVLFNKLDLS
jgi:hypothetical protein